jgi:hypothetical protein
VEIRKKLLEILVRSDLTEPSMHEPLVQLVQASKDWPKLSYALGYLSQLKSLRESDLERVSLVLNQPFVANSQPLKDQVQKVLAGFGYSPALVVQPLVDEYDPFAD